MVRMKKNETYVEKLIEAGMRIDERNFDEFREVKIERGIIMTAEGSAQVTIGTTKVIAGVKLELKTPYPDTPNEGNLMVDAEFVPIASPTFESGPPSEEAVELSRVVDRGVRESHCIDMAKLCLKEGELVWAVSIDIHILNYDGNLIDAASLAAIAALQDAKLPKIDLEKKTIVKDGPMVVRTKDKLPLMDAPVEVTIFKIGKKLLVDATAEEEESLEARVTMATNEKGNLCAMQKGGPGYFTTEELIQAADIAIEKGKELRRALD